MPTADPLEAGLKADRERVYDSSNCSIIPMVFSVCSHGARSRDGGAKYVMDKSTVNHVASVQCTLAELCRR